MKKCCRNSIFSCIFLSLANLAGASLVGDFAPLQVGNRWEYARLDTCYAGWYKGGVRLSVKSISVVGDNIVYEIQRTDSSYMNEYTNSQIDTIFESKDGQINSRRAYGRFPFYPFFKRHYYDDAETKQIEEKGATILTAKEGSSLFYKDQGLGEIDTVVVECTAIVNSYCKSSVPITIKLKLLNFTGTPSAINSIRAHKTDEIKWREKKKFNLLGRKLQREVSSVLERQK